jgi:hypothetical protein
MEIAGVLWGACLGLARYPSQSPSLEDLEKPLKTGPFSLGN